MLLLISGMYVSELCHLTFQDVDQEGDKVRIRPIDTIPSSYPRDVRLNADAVMYLMGIEIFRPYAEPDEPLFTSGSGKALEDYDVYQILHKLAERAGLQNAHPIRFRTTYVIEAFSNPSFPDNWL